MIMNSWRGSFDTNLRESLLTKISREFVTHQQSDHEQFQYFAQSLRSGKNLRLCCMSISKKGNGNAATSKSSEIYAAQKLVNSEVQILVPQSINHHGLDISSESATFYRSLAVKHRPGFFRLKYLIKSLCDPPPDYPCDQRELLLGSGLSSAAQSVIIVTKPSRQ